MNSKVLIIGLQYIPDFISVSEEKQLIEKIDEAAWLSDLKRRVQHYGYKYDYQARKVDCSMQIGALPDWSLKLAQRLQESNLIGQYPDQLIINEYQPGQGISKHIDCIPCFTNAIASLSLSSTCIMDFTHAKTGEKIPLWLEPRSLIILKDEVRYHWQHAIAPRKSDRQEDRKILRKRRLSLTFRKVILSEDRNL